MTTSPPEIIRGRVSCQGLAAADLELTIEGSLPQRFTVRDRLELVLEDKIRMAVETTGSKLLGKKVELRGNFGEYADHPLLAPFKVKAGPHLGFRIIGAAVQDGDEVVVQGSPSSSPEGTGDAELFRADLLASGPDAERQISAELERDRSKREKESRENAAIGPLRKNQWALYLLPALALCFVSLGGFDGLRLLAIALLLTGAAFAARRRAVPFFHALLQQDKEAETIDGTAERWPTWDFILGCYIFMVFIGITLVAVEAAAKLKLQFSPFLAIIPAEMVLLYLRNRQGPSVKRLRALLRAPRLPDQAADGAYGTVDGTMTCDAAPGGPAPVSCTWCEVRTYDADTGKAGGSIAFMSRAGKDLAIKTEKEAIGLKRGPGALWASALKFERRTCGWKQLYQNIGNSKIDTEDYIPEGSRVLAAGRIVNLGGQRAFSAEGAETTLVFASGKRDPRAVIRLTIAAYVLSLLLMLLAAAGPGVWGLVNRDREKTPEKAPAPASTKTVR